MSCTLESSPCTGIKGSLDHPKFNFEQESRADLGFLSCILKKLGLFLMIYSIYLSAGNSPMCFVCRWFYRDALRVYFTTRREIVCNEVTGAWGVNRRQAAFREAVEDSGEGRGPWDLCPCLNPKTNPLTVGLSTSQTVRVP